MKQYVIDELRIEDYEKVKAYLDETYGFSKIDGIYWVPLEESILSDNQLQHTECKPFFFAVEMGPDSLTCELLVRTRQKVHCTCIAYATELQRNWIIERMDAILEKLSISI